MAQFIIDYGSSANDGQGDPLRTAFIKTDENFDQIWAQGPVGSNITIVNNAVTVSNTNGNLVLQPNGVGVVQINAAMVPSLTQSHDLGSADRRWKTIFANNFIANSTSTTVMRTVSTTVSLLPAANTVGAGSRAFVTDANTSAFGTAVAGGAANAVPIYSDGTNWRVG